MDLGGRVNPSAQLKCPLRWSILLALFPFLDGAARAGPAVRTEGAVPRHGKAIPAPRTCPDPRRVLPGRRAAHVPQGGDALRRRGGGTRSLARGDLPLG